MEEISGVISVAKVRNKDIHKDVRLVGSLLRRIMPSFTTEQFYKLGEKCEKFLTGKWLGRKTVAESRYIDRPDGSRLRLLVCRAKGGTKPHATGLLWIHGGGYAIGAPEQDFFFVDPMVRDGGCVAVMPAYTLATKAPYPAALEDCYLALLWMRAHAEELGINPHQLFVGGDSAGGGLTAAVCLYARDRAEVNIAFQIPLYPMLDDRMITASSRDNDAPVWNTASKTAAWALYLKGIDRDHVPIYASPARAEDLHGLPPACTYVGTVEPFYDETLDFVARLRACGVDVRYREYPGCFHAFDMMGAGTKIGKDARAFLMESFFDAQTHYFSENGNPAVK